VVEFLKEALALLPKGMGIRCVRSDSGFFDQKLLRFLEEIGFSYIVVAKWSRQKKLKLCGIGDWVAVEGGNYEVISLRVKLGAGMWSGGLWCCVRKSGRRRRRWDAG
jgi:hypothetical protein